MEKALVQIIRSIFICVILYFAAKGMNVSGLPVPDLDARAAVEAAGMALENQKSIPEVVSVFSDAFIGNSGNAVSVSANADVPQ